MRVGVDGDVLDGIKADTRLLQTIADGMRRKSRPVLDAAKAFLFCGGNDLTVSNETRRSVGVIDVKSEDIYLLAPASGRPP